MATLTVSRLAPVTARDGVDTRKQENWGSTEVVNWETICRSDMIIGLGMPTVKSGNTSNELTASAVAHSEEDECDQCECCGVRSDLYNARCERCTDLGEEVYDDFRPYGEDIESEPDDEFYNQYLDIDDDFDF
jgi:hypothetical protein